MRNDHMLVEQESGATSIPPENLAMLMTTELGIHISTMSLSMSATANMMMTFLDVNYHLITDDIYVPVLAKR